MNCLNVDLLPVCTSMCFVCLVSVWWVNGLHQVNMSATVASQFLWRVRCVLSWYHNSWIPWNFSNNPNSDDIWDLLFNQPQFTINNFISLMCRWILTPSGNMKQSRRKFLSSLRHPTSNIGNIFVLQAAIVAELFKQPDVVSSCCCKTGYFIFLLLIT